MFGQYAFGGRTGHTGLGFYLPQFDEHPNDAGTGFARIYAKTDGKWYEKRGATTKAFAFAGDIVTDHGALGGLGDDDHTLYLLKTGLREWDEQGSDPSTPASTKWKLYFKSGGLYYIDDAGSVIGPLTPGSTPDLVYVATPGDTAINSVTDVTIFSRDVTGVAAGDQLLVEGWFQILNNSAAGRVYVFNVDFDGAFSARITTGTLGNHASDLHWFHFAAVCTVFNTAQAEMMLRLDGRGTTAQSNPGAPTMVATLLEEKDWNTSVADLTGTVTVTMNIQSSNTATTQTLRLRNATIRKLTPT